MKIQWKSFRSAPLPGRGNWLADARFSERGSVSRSHDQTPKRCRLIANLSGLAKSPRAADPRSGRKFRRTGGFLMVDAIMGLAILTIAILPLGYTFVRERQVLKIEYCRGVADEIVDGEMEILLAGAAKDLPDGPQPYAVSARAATQLPPGHFQLTKTGNHLRLEWTPDARRGFAPVAREAAFK